MRPSLGTESVSAASSRAGPDPRSIAASARARSSANRSCTWPPGTSLLSSVAVPSALLSGALALLILLFRDDLIAVIGFFGAYAIVRAVFLGISAFDTRGTAPLDLDQIEPGDDAFAPAN